MKKGWQKMNLATVLKRTETVNPLQSPEMEFEYIDVSSVSNLTFQIEETQQLRGKDAPSRARKLVRTNDVIFATIRPTLQRIAVVPEDLDHQVCSTGYFVLRPEPEIDHRFLFHFLFTDSFMEQMECLQKGASYPAVTDGDVKAQEIPVPPLSEQQRIVGILDEAFAGIAVAKANAEKTWGPVAAARSFLTISRWRSIRNTSAVSRWIRPNVCQSSCTDTSFTTRWLRIFSRPEPKARLWKV
jgi:type I restriction enzyme, S subunit